MTPDRQLAERMANAWGAPNLSSTDKQEETARLAREATLLPWRPIETAPKDGTPILVAGHAGPEWMISVFEWYGENSGFWSPVGASGYDCERDFDPTHWMPLPAPPEDL